MAGIALSGGMVVSCSTKLPPTPVFIAGSRWVTAVGLFSCSLQTTQQQTPLPVQYSRISSKNAEYTHTRLTALFRDYPGEPVPERQSQCGFYWSKRQWVAVASAGPYANLHLAPDRQPCQHPTTQFFYRPDALPAAQPTASKHWRLDTLVVTNQTSDHSPGNVKHSPTGSVRVSAWICIVYNR